MSDRIPNDQQSGSDAASFADPHHITDTGPEPGLSKGQTSVHPIAIEVALAAAFWFIAVTWVSFASGTEVDWTLSWSPCSSSSSSRCFCSPHPMG